MKLFKNCTRFIYCAFSEADFKLTTNYVLVSIRAYELRVHYRKIKNHVRLILNVQMLAFIKNVKLMQLRKDFLSVIEIFLNSVYLFRQFIETGNNLGILLLKTNDIISLTL